METSFAEAMSTENMRLERDLKLAEDRNAADLAEREQEWDSICLLSIATLAVWYKCAGRLGGAAVEGVRSGGLSHA